MGKDAAITSHNVLWVNNSKPFVDTWDFSAAISQGFKAKHSKAPWTAADDIILRKAFKELHTKDSIIHIQDEYRWFQSHVFNNRVHKSTIREKIAQINRE